MPRRLTRIQRLIRDLTAVLDQQGHGSRKALADHLKVTKQKLNFWLNGTYDPGGEHALALREWLEKQRESGKERQ